ncbi:hypothetical protein R1sor_016194 [Riccia sorocarpa]|uniref:Uncharacterized protein n=1 Tax=Riccia sorocarpa TaxID=122646 RepID=A0ABD3HIE2_9MARC
MTESGYLFQFQSHIVNQSRYRFRIAPSVSPESRPGGIVILRPDSSVHTVRKGFVLFAMVESGMATAESKEVITLKETKAWLQSKSAGGSRVVRARLSRIGFRGKATYVGCPMCAKSIHARDRCVHDITSPKSFYRLKAYLEDATGELEATAWEATRCFTGMPLEEYVAKEMREEESEI